VVKGERPQFCVERSGASREQNYRSHLDPDDTKTLPHVLLRVFPSQKDCPPARVVFLTL